jgi:hypothetical protein
MVVMFVVVMVTVVVGLYRGVIVVGMSMAIMIMLWPYMRQAPGENLESTAMVQSLVGKCIAQTKNQ